MSDCDSSKGCISKLLQGLSIKKKNGFYSDECFHPPPLDLEMYRVLLHDIRNIFRKREHRGIRSSLHVLCVVDEFIFDEGILITGPSDFFWNLGGGGVFFYVLLYTWLVLEIKYTGLHWPSELD